MSIKIIDVYRRHYTFYKGNHTFTSEYIQKYDIKRYVIIDDFQNCMGEGNIKRSSNDGNLECNSQFCRLKCKGNGLFNNYLKNLTPRNYHKD